MSELKRQFKRGYARPMRRKFFGHVVISQIRITEADDTRITEADDTRVTQKDNQDG